MDGPVGGDNGSATSTIIESSSKQCGVERCG